LAHLRRAQGLPALTIDWGPWSEVGMAARLDGGDYTRWAREGMGVIDPAGGMAALRLAVAQRRPYLAIAPLAASDAARAAGTTSPAATGERSSRQQGGARQPELVARYRQTPPSLQRKLLLDYVAEQAARTIGLPSAYKIDPGQPLHDIGLDSLMAVELRNLLGAACGKTLPATLLFDYPTVAAVAGYLQSHAALDAAPDAAPDGRGQPAAAPARSADERPLEELTDAEAEALLLAELSRLS
jgi:acyl carrier protein